MKKIAIISVYFGKFPNNYNLWLKSCEYNPDIDFIIITDQNYESSLLNLKYIHMKFEDFNNLMKKKIGEEFNISKPYKCCDFRPAWGIILEDFLESYDFWGHCDLDLIFGDIRKYITDQMLNKYDKILPLGHLSLYRNTEEVNNRYKCEGSKLGNYKNVFKDNDNIVFDETFGIAQIYEKNNFPFYKERIFADITKKRKRFTLSRKDPNYKYQVFYWEKGHVYRAYQDNETIKTEEFIYIHFQKRGYIKDLTNQDNIDSFYICDKGFINKEKGIPSLNDIKKYNRYPGYLYEKMETLNYNIKYYFTRIKKRLKKKSYYKG